MFDAGPVSTDNSVFYTNDIGIVPKESIAKK